MNHCMFCGKTVSDGDWDYLGSDRVWVCSSFECLVERSDAHRAAQEQAQLDAMEDGYGRYLR